MSKFEYKHKVVEGLAGFNDISELGLEGWELITVIPQPGKFLYIFKRELHD